MVDEDSIAEAPSVLNEVLAGQKLRETKSAKCLDIVESITVRKSKKLRNIKKKKRSTEIKKSQKRCNKANMLICCCSPHRKRIPHANKLRKANIPSKITNRLLLTKSQYIRMLSKPKPNYYAPNICGKPIKKQRKSAFYQIPNAEITRLSRPTRAKLLVTFQKYHDVLPASKLESLFSQLQRGNDDDNKKSKKKCCELYAIECLATKFAIKLTAFLTLQCNRSRNIRTIETIAELIFLLLRSADGKSCHANICTISEDMWEYLCASAHFLACILDVVYCKYETIKKRPPAGSDKSRKRDTEDKSDSFSSEESSQSDDGSAYGTAHLEISKTKISPFYSTEAQQGRHPDHYIEIADDKYNKNTGQAAFSQLSRLERDRTPTRKQLYQQRDLSLKQNSRHYLEINTGDDKTGRATVLKLERLEQDRTLLGKQQLSQKSDTPKALKTSKLEKLKILEQVAPGKPQFSKKVDIKTQKTSFSVRRPRSAIGVSDIPNLRSPKDKPVKQEGSTTDFSEDDDKGFRYKTDPRDHHGYHTPKQESPKSLKDIKQKHLGDKDSSDDDQDGKYKSAEKHRHSSSKLTSPESPKQTSPKDKKQKDRRDRDSSDTSPDRDLQKGRRHKSDDRPDLGSSKISPTDGKQTSPKDISRKRRADIDSADDDQDGKHKSADKYRHVSSKEEFLKGPKQTSPKDQKQKDRTDRDSLYSSSDSDLQKRRKHKSHDRSDNGFSKRSPTDGKQTSSKDTLQKYRGDRDFFDDNKDRIQKSADKHRHSSSKDDFLNGSKQTSPKDKKQKDRRDRDFSDTSSDTDFQKRRKHKSDIRPDHGSSKRSPNDGKQRSSEDTSKKRRGDKDSPDYEQDGKYKSADKRRHGSSKEDSPKGPKQTSPIDKKQDHRGRDSSDTTSERDLQKGRRHKSSERLDHGSSKKSPTDKKQTSPKDTLRKRREGRDSADYDQDEKHKSADKYRFGSSKDDFLKGFKQTSPKAKKQEDRRDRDSSDTSDNDQKSKETKRNRKQPSSKGASQKDRKDREPVDSSDKDLHDKHKSEDRRKHFSYKEGYIESRKKSPKDTIDSSGEDLGGKSKKRYDAHRGWHEPRKKNDNDRSSSDFSDDDHKSKKLKSLPGDAYSKEKKSAHRGWHKTKDSSPEDNRQTLPKSRKHKDLKDRRSSSDLSDGDLAAKHKNELTKYESRRDQKQKSTKDGSSDSDDSEDLSKRKSGPRSPRRYTSSSPRSHLSSSPLRESPDAHGKESPESPYGKRRKHPDKKRTSRGSLSGKSSLKSESMLDALEKELSKSPTRDKNYFRSKKTTESEKDVIRDEQGRPIKDSKISDRKSKDKIEKTKSGYIDKSVKGKTSRDMSDDLSIDEKSDDDVEKGKKRAVKPKKEGIKDEAELSSDSGGSQKHISGEKLKNGKKDTGGDKDLKSPELKKTIASDSKSTLKEIKSRKEEDIIKDREAGIKLSGMLDQEEKMRKEKDRQKSEKDKSSDESETGTSSVMDTQKTKKDIDKRDKTKDRDETESEALSELEVPHKMEKGFTDKEGKKMDYSESELLEDKRRKDKKKPDTDLESGVSLSETEDERKEKKGNELKTKDESGRESKGSSEFDGMTPEKRITDKLPQEKKPFESRIKDQDENDLKSDKIVDDISKTQKRDVGKDFQDEDQVKSEGKKKLVEDDKIIDADKRKQIEDDLKHIMDDEEKKSKTSKMPVKDIKTDREKDLVGFLDEKKYDKKDRSEESETTSEIDSETEESDKRKKDLPRVSLPDYIHGEDKELPRYKPSKIKDKPYVEEEYVNDQVTKHEEKQSINDDYLQGQDIIKALEKGGRSSSVIGGHRYDQPSKSDNKIDGKLRSDFMDDVVVLNVKESDSIESDIMSSGHRKLFIFPKVKQATYPASDIRLDKDKRIKCPFYGRITQKSPYVDYGSSHDKQKHISSLTKCIIPHVNIMPHGTERICCASLKAWALWIKDVAESAKVWCHWINTVICDMQTITALMRGEKSERVITCEDWRNFAQRFDSDICIWHHYNKHVEKNTKQILNYCNCARVTQYCNLCQRENLQSSSKNADHLYKQLAVALKTTKYWRTWLHSMVLESQSLFDLIEGVYNILVSCKYAAYRPKCICKCNDRFAQCSIYSIRSLRE
ncbi:titin homolog [Chrysoperla carnea]|uniref:titin homolog n=1 Tax=Chrysoperla carnea TaxID=189513 RepID=UPI001D07DB0A|nr:titin homolog [Chrysoperla carnea]